MLPTFGIQFSNRLSGTGELAEGEPGQRPLQLTLEGQVPSPMQLLFGATITLQGTITLPGLAAGRPLAGELEIQPLRGMRLALRFADDDGAPCRLEATKDFELGAVFKGHVAVDGELHREGSTGPALGRVRLDVDLLSSFGQFWGSLRPAP